MLRRILTPPTLKPLSYEAAPRWPLFLGLALALVLTFVLYLNTLSLPFFQDDVIHARWLSTRSVIDPWLTAENLPTYRPLGESLLKVWFIILGGNVPAVLRLQNILMHVLNAALVALLALRLDHTKRRYITAGIAATLFAAFPLAYQAVIWINVFFYPLGTLLLLLAALSYWRARTRGSLGWLLITWLLCFLAPAEIEWGLMSGAILFGLEILWWLEKRSTRPWLVGPIVGIGVNVIYFVIWQIVPKFDYARGMQPFDVEGLLQKSTYFLQGFIYPTAPLATPLMGQFGLNDLNAVRLVAAITLVPMLALLIRRKRTLMTLAGLAWFALLILPSLLTTDFDYVINSPRLLYPAIVGGVIIWGAFAAEVMTAGRAQIVRVALTLLAITFVLGQNIAFVRTETHLYHIAEEPVHALARAARLQPDGDPLLFVNLPSWLSPIEHAYAVGNHGVQFITGYAGINDVIFAYNGRDRFSRAISFTSLSTEVPYYFGLYGPKLDWDGLIDQLKQSGEVYFARYEPERIRLLPAGRMTKVDLGIVTARLGSQLELGTTQVESNAQVITVTLNWRIAQTPNQDLSVFVHVYAPDGSLVTQSDGYPLLGLAPFGNWDAGQTLQDRHTLDWPKDAPAGPYRVGVGVYDRGTGQRLEGFDVNGNRLPDDTVVIRRDMMFLYQ
ncbi:MAG: hypothetical protein HY870_01680 [Chloroflexi bacterium]|nr:hypothetical protein [Chloroflexota bacterium]